MANMNRTKILIAEEMKNLVEKGKFEKITVQDLIQKCQISRNTFYYHFKDKYEVVNWFFAYHMSQIWKKDKEKNFVMEFEQHLLKTCEHIQKYRVFYIKILQIKVQNSFSGFLRKFFEEKLDEIITDENLNEYYSEEHKIFVIRFYVDAIIQSINRWADKEMENDPTPFAKIVVKILGREFLLKM